MVQLIREDPERAIKMAFPSRIREKLPPAIRGLVERPHFGRGDLYVLAGIPMPGHEVGFHPVLRSAEIDGERYSAFVYGRRLGEPTRTNLPLHGIVLENQFAIAENPIRLVPGEESADLPGSAIPKVCAWCSRIVDSGSDPQIIETEQGLASTCNTTEAALLNEQRIAAEWNSNPTTLASGTLQMSASYTTGTKDLLLIRVDFDDLEGIPFSDQTGIDMITGVNLFYRENSNGQAGFSDYGQGSDITPTFRMPHPASYYGTNNYFTLLRNDARTAAKAGGYNLSSYHFDLVCFAKISGFDWAGLGIVGGAGVWLNSYFTVGVAAHELGHNFGLNHANFWKTADESVLGPGASVEYGDPFDTMGSATAGYKHFNTRWKNYLNWLPSAEVASFSTNGIYQLFAHDLTNSVPGFRALSLPQNSTTNFWFEFRQKNTGNKWLMSGLGVRWAQSGNQPTLLLDTTPGSLNGKEDSPITFGRTFADEKAQIFVTPLGPGGTTPESVMVMVNRGPFPAKKNPAVKLSAHATQVAPGESVDFTCSATDPNGDELAYSWDFGDHNFGTNAPNQSYRWQKNGMYLVRCTVSDMMGGEASDSLVIQVGNPAGFTLTGQVIANGVPARMAKVSASTQLFAYTDSDGSYKILNVNPGSYTLTAGLSGYTFLHPGFPTPVEVSDHRDNLNFLALQTRFAFIPEGSIWSYLDNGQDQGTNWIQPDFDDQNWKTGPAKLGYGDSTVNTAVSYGSSASKKYITTYFRARFTVGRQELVNKLTLDLLRDDGAVVYLNGREAWRSNLPEGPIAFNTLASSAVSGTNESTFFTTALNPSWLIAGTNFLAVEVHQSSQTSSDLLFDMRLTGEFIGNENPPSMTWETADSRLLLAWPLTALNWSLFSSPGSTAPGQAWEPVYQDWEILNDHFQVVLPTTHSSRIFQLVLP